MLRRRRASRLTSPAPPPLTNDQHHAGDKSVKLITVITICVIFVMLLFVYRSIVTVLLVLVHDVHRVGGGPRNRCGPWLLRPHRAVDVRGQPAHHARHRRGNGLRDLPRRPLSRGAPERRGSRNRLLHHVSRHRARHPGLGSDDRRRDVLPALHPAAVLPDARHSVGDRHARRGVRRADHGAGVAHRLPAVSACSTPSERCRHAAGAGSALPSCVGRVRSLPRRWLSRWSACWRCRGTRRATTTASYLPSGHPGQRRATPPPTGISRRPG